MKTRLFLLTSIVLLLSFSLAQAQDDYEVELDSNRCPVELPDDFDLDVTCYTLTLPQDRSEPDGLQVEIAMAVVEATGDDPADEPFWYLDGGPGGHTLENWLGSVPSTFEPFLENHDIVLMDYRGVGYSEPNLRCTETSEYELETLDEDIPDAQGVEEYFATLEECRQRLTDDGVILDFYDSATIAMDIVDAMEALEYEQVNFLGISYGTRLLLTIMRDFPEIVRTSIIDAVAPPQIDQAEDYPRIYTRVFDQLFDSCAADEVCDARYPDLREVTFDLARQLDEEPAEFEVTFGDPEETYDVVFDGASLVSFLFSALYSESIIPSLPRIIYAAAEGDYRLLAYVQGLFLDGDRTFTNGMLWAVRCNEEFPFLDLSEAKANAAEYPEIAEFTTVDGLIDLVALQETCALWVPEGAEDIENEPVESDLPTLVLNGQFDPVTPPEYGEAAAETLPNSFVFTFPSLAHGATLTGDECVTSIVLSFIDDPETEPDGDCIEDMRMVFDALPERIELEEFEDNTQRIEAVYPQGWQPAGQSGYTAAPFSPNFLGFFRYPNDGGDFLDVIYDFYSAEPDDRAENVEAGNAEWEIYRTEDVESPVVGVVVIATARFGGDVVTILLTTGTDEEADQLTDELLLPILEEIRVRR
ncbi:MAG: alpha/beta hydrolase [Chloroflexota bacterium]|nr:alpha/beta hydrolase [Chloroflexota bacterium]